MVLAVVVGTLVLSILSIIICAGLAGSMSAGGSAGLARSGILKIDFSRVTVGEQTMPQNPLGEMSKQQMIETIGILDAVNAIKIAAEDSGVKLIYLKTDGCSLGLATAQEIRKALADFRKNSGKPIIAYMENPGTLSYYMASVADKVYMTSLIGGSCMLTGVGVQQIFLKDLLDKFGINFQLIRHGKYKAAGEMFIRNSSSPENREQNQRMVDSIWESMRSEICNSRGIDESEFDSAIDNLELAMPEDFLSHKLVDGLLSHEEMEEKLATASVVESFDKVKMLPFSAYTLAKVSPNYKIKRKIAVVFADGEITEGNDSKEVAGDRFASLIAKVRCDSTVKAVVLRVNSPGGSVIASEKIKQEIGRTQKVKPVVASFGGYAASGGYWISNACDKIFSDATTITGSIGVFGLVPDFGKAAKDKLHIGVEAITTNKHGDMYNLMRPLDNDENAFWTRQIERIYDKFTSIVAEGRDMPQEKVDEIGQGRVWTGADALKIGLVDEIGTLQDAIVWAALAAGNSDLSSWQILEQPAPLTTMEMMMEIFSPQPADEQGVLLGKLKECRSPKVLARMPYNISIY